MTSIPPFPTAAPDGPTTPATGRSDRRPGRGWLSVGLVLAVAAIVVWTGLTVHQQFHGSVQFSQQNRTFTGPVRAIDIAMPAGRVTVIAVNGGTVRVTAVTTSNSSLQPQDVEHLHRGVLKLGSACRAGFFSDCTVSYTVDVPLGTAVTVTLDTGTVTVTATGSTATLKTGNGDINVDHASTVTAITGTGSVTVTDAGQVDANTGNGDIHLVRVSGPLQAKTGTGTVSGAQLAVSTANVKVGNGDVSLAFTTLIGSTLTLTVGTGSVTVIVPAGSGPYQVQATAGTGRTIDNVRTDPTSTTKIHARTANGNISVQYGP